MFPIPTDDEILTEPGIENLRASLNDLGYASAYLSNNLGSVYVFAFLTSVVLILSGFLELCTCDQQITQLNGSIKKRLHWNFVIRLLIEAAMEIAFGCYLNFKYGHFNVKLFGAVFNYISTIVLGGALLILPFFILIFYSYNFYRLADEEFESKYGAVYEGLHKTKKSILFYPVFFIIKRISFALSSLLLLNYPLFQLYVLTAMTLIACVYILEYQPFEDPFMNRMEVFNECFTLILIYFAFCFTPLVQSVKHKYFIGFLFIGGMVICIGTHLFFIFKDMVS